MEFINVLAENGPWLPHDLKEVFWGTLAFLIVASLLYKFGAAPVTAAFTGRTARIGDELDSAATTRRDAELARDQVKADLADSANKAAEIVGEAEGASDGVTQEIIARAEVSATQLRERSVVELASAEQQALSDIEGEFGRLAYGAAERVVTANLDDPTQQRLIDEYIARVAAN